MRYAKRSAVLAAMCAALTTTAWAQRMGPQAPQLPGLFQPVVGSGAQYEITGKGEKMVWSYAVVGKENYQGSEGYWLEMRMDAAGKGGAIMKQLVVKQPEGVGVKRMIMQSPGQPPIEMPMGMFSGMMKRAQQSAASKEKEGALGVKLGTEMVTVPAGTFLCDHYKTQHEKSTADIWVSSKIPPYGLVKLTSAETSMVLLKVLANETSHITGTPQKLELPHF